MKEIEIPVATKENKIRKRFVFALSFLLLCIVFPIYMKYKNRELIIRDIAYDVNKRLGYTVYMEEKSEYGEGTEFVPYLVLTDQYNDNVLLLRKDLLSKGQIYNDYYGYYEDSHIDQYLNQIFIQSLTSEMQDKILDSNIIITAKSSLGVVGTDISRIERKVFLLSFVELGLMKRMKTDLASMEGKPLKYFTDSKDASIYIAYRKGKATSWTLRTSYTIYDSTVWGIGPDGRNGGGGAYYTNGIRPAFCVSKSLKIIKSEEVINGQEVYILK